MNARILVPAALRTVAKALLKNPLSVFLTLFLPLLMFLFLGFIATTAQGKNVKTKPIPIALAKQDQAADAEVLERLLKTPAMEPFVVFSQTPSVRISVPQDFSQRLAKGRTSQVILQPEGRGGFAELAQVAEQVSAAGKILSKNHVFDVLIAQGKLSQVQAQALRVSLEKEEKAPLFQEEFTAPVRVLTEYEKQAAAVYSVFFFITMIMAIFQGLMRDRESGLFARLKATPNGHGILYNYYVVSGFFSCLFLSLLLTGTIKATGLAFSALDLPTFFAVNFLLSLCTTGLGAITLIFRNKLAMTGALMLFLYVQLFLTGGMMPKLVQNPLVDALVNYLPGEVVRQFLLTIQLEGSWSLNLSLVAVLLGLGAAGYALGYLGSRITWKEGRFL